METTYQLPNNRTLKVITDVDPQSPREWDNLGKMVCFHTRYNLGDEHEMTREDLLGIIKRKDVVALPLYLYDHSVITMNTSGFSCGWDTSAVGYIYITHEQIRKEYSVKRVSQALREKIATYLTGEVETYDQFLIGDVYGFEIVKVEECNMGCDHEEDEDSCWGFFGDDIKTNGILDNISQEDREAVMKLVA